MTFNWNYPGKGSIQKNLYTSINGVLKDGPTTYTILHGPTGNGKTTMVYEIAKLLNVDVLRITAESSYTIEDVNHTIKLLNLQKYDSDKKHIILIDDFDDFNNKKKFQTFPKYSNFPIIYTAQSLKAFDKDFYLTDKCNHIKVDKLTPSFLFDVLESYCIENNVKVDEQKLHNISTACPSIRKGLIMVKTDTEAREYHPNINIYKQVQNRILTKNLNYWELKNLIESIRTYRDCDYQLMNRFSYLEFLMKYDPMNNYAHTQYLDEDAL